MCASPLSASVTVELRNIKAETASAATVKKAVTSARFFKTGKGEYGEGDLFLGITVPEIRKIAGRHADASVECIECLLDDPVHEHRLLALLILVKQFAKGDLEKQRSIKDFYLAKADRVNNWDLVDSSADKILGMWLLSQKDRSVLDQLASTDHLWRQRIAIIATFAMIREESFGDTLRIAEALIDHEHDLIHKAVGWMLREVGKRDLAQEEEFLRKHAQNMPRTMLRYAIECFPEEQRQAWLKGKHAD